MAYVKPDTKLVMRIQPTTMGDAGDGIGDDTVAGSTGTIAGAIANFFTPKPQVATAVPSTGIDTTTLLILGALGLGGFFVYKKMKKR